MLNIPSMKHNHTAEKVLSDTIASTNRHLSLEPVGSRRTHHRLDETRGHESMSLKVVTKPTSSSIHYHILFHPDTRISSILFSRFKVENWLLTKTHSIFIQAGRPPRSFLSPGGRSQRPVRDSPALSESLAADVGPDVALRIICSLMLQRVEPCVFLNCRFS